LPIRTLAPVLMAHALSSTRTGLRRKEAAVAMDRERFGSHLGDVNNARSACILRMGVSKRDNSIPFHALRSWHSQVRQCVSGKPSREQGPESQITDIQIRLPRRQAATLVHGQEGQRRVVKEDKPRTQPKHKTEQPKPFVPCLPKKNPSCLPIIPPRIAICPRAGRRRFSGGGGAWEGSRWRRSASSSCIRC
jgi:hypothetical protein